MDVHEAINNRRAYRSLDPVEISDDLIKDLAEKAQIAPSCSNNQPWNFIFIKDREQLKKIFTTLTKGFLTILVIFRKNLNLQELLQMIKIWVIVII